MDKSLLRLGLSNAEVFEAFLQRGDFTEPTPVVGFDEALLGVIRHLCDTA